jgi:hypothetical protein
MVLINATSLSETVDAINAAAFHRRPLSTDSDSAEASRTFA